MSDLKIVKTFNTRVEAELAKGLLEVNNIKAILLSDDANGTRPEFTLVHGVRLMVNTKDLKKAEEILK